VDTVDAAVVTVLALVESVEEVEVKLVLAVASFVLAVAKLLVQVV